MGQSRGFGSGFRQVMSASILGFSLGGCAVEPSRPGALSNIPLGRENEAFSAAVPKIAIDPADPKKIAVIWRAISMKEANQNNAPRDFQCHLSLSRDGGRTFRALRLTWGSPRTPVCNSPFVDIGPHGELLIGATLAGVLPQGAPEGAHPFGQVGIRHSSDWGSSWSATRGLITSNDAARFAPNPTVPVDATKVPWDGGRGVIDQSSGLIAISGGFPAPPGEGLHSQRFLTSSTDGGRNWGEIFAFGGAGWPQRWDGSMVAAHGRLAFSYLGDAVPDASVTCLCIIFGTSTDGGKTVERHLVAQTDGFDKLVHYPPLSAHPAKAGVYALAFIAKAEAVPQVRMTRDNGSSWQVVAGLQTPSDVVRASRPAIAHDPNGTIMLLWRGYSADGRYDMFMAAAPEGELFGPTVRVSTASSREPDIYRADYSVTGDFISSLAAGPDAAHAAWTDWRSDKVARVIYARVPTVMLTSQN